MKKKRLVTNIALLVVVGMMMNSFPAYASMNYDVVLKENTVEDATYGTTIEDILDTYNEQKAELKESADALSQVYTLGAQTSRWNDNCYEMELENLKDERDAALENAGYEVYRVENSNYTETEQMLQCDLAEMGLDEEGKYLIIIGDENSNQNEAGVMAMSSRGTVGNSFTYKYNGNTLIMRTLTVCNDDDEASNYAQSTSVGIIQSSNVETVKRLMNMAVSWYVGEVNTYVGMVYDMMGVELPSTGYVGETSIRFYAYAEWTRVYTQVWDSYDELWSYCSCVERVDYSRRLAGYYWDNDTKSMEWLDTGKSKYRRYSDEYNDTTWKRRTAAQVYLSSGSCEYDVTGDVRVEWNGYEQIRFREPSLIYVGE